MIYCSYIDVFINGRKTFFFSKHFLYTENLQKITLKTIHTYLSMNHFDTAKYMRFETDRNRKAQKIAMCTEVVIGVIKSAEWES